MYMVYLPSSTVHGTDPHPLRPGGEDELLTLDNAGDYVRLMYGFCANVRLGTVHSSSRAAGLESVLTMSCCTGPNMSFKRVLPHNSMPSTWDFARSSRCKASRFSPRRRCCSCSVANKIQSGPEMI